MAPHVEDARDRLVAMNRPIPEPTQEAVAENDAEERSRQPLRFTDRTLGLIKHGPTVVEAVHVGEPTWMIQSGPWRRISPRKTSRMYEICERASLLSRRGSHANRAQRASAQRSAFAGAAAANRPG